VVVVFEEKPKPEVRELLLLFETRLFFIHGSLLFSDDLALAGLTHSAGVFLLNNIQGTKAIQMEGDMRNILRVLSVRNAGMLP